LEDKLRELIISDKIESKLWYGIKVLVKCLGILSKEKKGERKKKGKERRSP
jgi:hypothetical protein